MAYRNEEVISQLHGLNLLNLQPRVSEEELSFDLMALHWNPATKTKEVTILDPPILPYFFVRKNPIMRRRSDCIKYLQSFDPGSNLVEVDAESFRQEPLYLVECSNPKIVGPLAREIRAGDFEADMSMGNGFWRRIACDLGLQVQQPEDQLYIDLEVDTRKGMHVKWDASGRVLSIGAVNVAGEEFWFSQQDEVQMFYDFLELSMHYPYLNGWNTEGFDIPYLLGRAKKLEIPLEEFQIPWLDCQKMYRQMKPKGIDDYSLDATAVREGVGEKLETETPDFVNQLYEWFLHDPERLRKYNLRDCHLVRLLDKKLGMTDLRVELGKLTYMLPTKMRGRMTPADNLVLHTAQYVPLWDKDRFYEEQRSPRVVFPSKPKFTGKEKSYEGPIVIQPVPGIHQNVPVIDFVNMHPSIIMMLNIGMETYRDNKTGGIIALHGSYIDSKRSVLCDALGNLTKLRYFFKNKRDTFLPKSREWEIYDAKQKGTKTQLLSAYGMQGSPKSRFYSIANAENITLSCQLVQGYAVSVAGQLGAPTLYGVTDSLMIKLADSASVEDCVMLGQMICGEVNRKMQEFTRFTFKNPQYQIKVDLDRVYKDLLLTKKKQKYSGRVCFEEDKPVNYIHTMGFQSRKGDTPRLAKKVQDTVLEMRLDRKPAGEIQRYLDGVKRELFAGKCDKLLVVSKGLSMPVENYKPPIPPHVRVVKQLAAQGIDVRVGDKVKYITVGEDRAGRVEVVPYLDYAPPKLQVYEYKFIWERSILKVVEDIMPERKVCTLMEQWK